MLVLLVLVVATSVGVAGGALVRRVVPAFGAVVSPRADRWHEQPTPTMGGIAIVAATAVGFLPVLFWPETLPWIDTWFPVPMAAFAMFVVGLFDDQWQLSPLAKLVASLVVGAFLVFALSRSEPGGLPWFSTLVATVWFAGLDRKSTRVNSSHVSESRMPSSA